MYRKKFTKFNQLLTLPYLSSENM